MHSNLVQVLFRPYFCPPQPPRQYTALVQGIMYPVITNLRALILALTPASNGNIEVPEPQITVEVLTVPFSCQDSRASRFSMVVKIYTLFPLSFARTYHRSGNKN